MQTSQIVCEYIPRSGLGLDHTLYVAVLIMTQPLSTFVILNLNLCESLEVQFSYPIGYEIGYPTHLCNEQTGSIGYGSCTSRL